MYTPEHLLTSSLVAHSNVVEKAFNKDLKGKDSCLHWFHATELLSISKYLSEDIDFSDNILEIITDIIECIDSDSLSTLYNLSLIDSDFSLPNNSGVSGNITIRPKLNEKNIVVDNLSTNTEAIFELSIEHEGESLYDKLSDIDETIESLDDLYLSKDDTVTEEVTVNGVGSVGGVDDGYTFPVGMSFQEYLTKVYVKSNPASYSQSTSSISDNISNVVEVGETFTPTLSISYTKRDSGDAIRARFYRNGSLINTDESIPFSFTASSEDLVNDGDYITYSGQVDHEQGDQKYDNLGNPSGDPSVLVPARNGLSSGSTSITARRKIFYGKNNSQPSNSSDVRSFNYNQFSTDNTFSINVNNGDTSVEFAIPSNKTLSSVIFVGALVNDETSVFLSSEQIISVNGDENKYPDNYKIYRYSPSVPFGSDAVYNITIS